MKKYVLATMWVAILVALLAVVLIGGAVVFFVVGRKKDDESKPPKSNDSVFPGFQAFGIQNPVWFGNVVEESTAETADTKTYHVPSDGVYALSVKTLQPDQIVTLRVQEGDIGSVTGQGSVFWDQRTQNDPCTPL